MTSGKLLTVGNSLPKIRSANQLSVQADSVGANIAEGVERGSYQDNKRFVKIARGSLYETQHWLRRAYTRNLLTVQQVNTFTTIINDLAPQLNSYLQSIGSSPKNDDQ